MPEGSVSIEGEDFDEESVDTQDIDNDSASEAQEKGESPKPEGQPQGEDVKRTEKGTKLAEDPLQQANQIRANAEARVREYERFLSDPEQVKRYLEDLQRDSGRGQAPQDELTIDKVQTVEDVQRFLAQEKQKLHAEIEEVQRLKYGLAGQAVEEKVNQRIERDIDEVRRAYPELRQFNPDGSPNPEFDPDLERELGELFDELDLDPQSGRYRGSVSLKKLADRVMKAAKRGQAQGSKRAQTVVQDRREGRVITGTTTPSQPDESAMSASQSIAARIKRAAEARR
jgi:hypothetical protein